MTIAVHLPENHEEKKKTLLTELERPAFVHQTYRFMEWENKYQ